MTRCRVCKKSFTLSTKHICAKPKPKFQRCRVCKKNYRLGTKHTCKIAKVIPPKVKPPKGKPTIVPEDILKRWPAKDVGHDAMEYVKLKKTRELWGTIFDLRTGKVSTFKKMIEATRDARLVLVGERHDVGAHHVLQTDVLLAMHANNPKQSLAMEMFWKIYQPVLDKYVRGEIDEQTMIRQTHYKETWNFDYNYFKKALNFAAKNKFPIIGANLPKTIMRKIARGIELTPAEKAMLPKNIDTTNKEHRKHVMWMFQGMSQALKTRAPELLKSGFEDRFYLGQCTWDEMFAEVAAKYLMKNKGHQMVMFVGGGHTVKRHNIPERFKRRSKMKYLSIYPIGLESRKRVNWVEQLNLKTADFLVITKPF